MHQSQGHRRSAAAHRSPSRPPIPKAGSAYVHGAARATPLEVRRRRGARALQSPLTSDPAAAGEPVPLGRDAAPVPLRRSGRHGEAREGRASGGGRAAPAPLPRSARVPVRKRGLRRVAGSQVADAPAGMTAGLGTEAGPAGSPRRAPPRRERAVPGGGRRRLLGAGS